METQDKAGAQWEREEPTTSHHWRRAAMAGAMWWVLAFVAVAATGGLGDAEGIGYAAGSLMVPFLLASAVAGILARRSSREWGWTRHLLVTLGTGLVVAVFMAIGRLGSS